MIGWLVLIFIIVQRLSELVIARRNEQWMKSQGAIEYGQSHYPAMVAIHASFFIVLLGEIFIFHRTLSPVWPLWFVLFIAAQAGRIWVIASLGKYWNTKIIVLPGAKPVDRGPFKYVKHPNYWIVTVELIVIPLLFNAYITAILFFVLNQIILRIRIPQEEAALREHTEYPG